MKTVLIALLVLSVQCLFGQTTEYFTAEQVDSMAYLPEDAVKIPRSMRKRREKKGLAASTPEVRFLQSFYSTISISTETRLEEVKSYNVELELQVDSMGKLSVGNLFFLYDGVAPKLPEPFSVEPLVVSVYSTGGTIKRNKPVASKDKPEWSKGQMALARSLLKAFSSFPDFVPAQIDGVAVDCRWTVHMKYRSE